MRAEGLAPLPMRLNNLKRVKADKEFKRIKSGKYGVEYKFIPIAAKTEKMGSALGTIYAKDHTNPKKSLLREKKRWLGKVGVGSDICTSGSKSFSSKEIKTERGMNATVLLEYVANNLYRLLGDGSFETTKMRLCYLPIMDIFTKNHEVAKAYVYNHKITKSLRIMSKWIEEYQNLSQLKIKDEGKVIKFMDYIKKYKKPPELIIDPETKKEIELKGIMGVLAAATSIADVDVLGGSGKNTGFILERDKDKKVIRARVVKIDPGEAFSYERIKKSKDPRDIQFAPMLDLVIEWIKDGLVVVRDGERTIELEPAKRPVDWTDKGSEK